MADAIVKHENSAPAFNQAQIELIRKTVAPSDATLDELKLFLHVAARAGLDPLAKQIHMTKRSGKLAIVAGIDGLRARASRESDYEGILHAVVCAKDELEFDAASGCVSRHSNNPFAERGPIVGAWATVKRKGKLPFTAIVRFSEFNVPQSPTWRQMPAVMIDKVAQSTALRMAYPEQFSSIYEQAELDQAEPPRVSAGEGATALKAKLAELIPDVPKVQVVEEPPPHDDADFELEPAPPDSATPEDPPMTYGKNKGMALKLLGPGQLKWYRDTLTENLADPAKAAFKTKNQAALDSILREIARRS